MKKLLLLPFTAPFSGNPLRAKVAKMLLATLLLCTAGFKGFGLVTVTQGTGGTGICPSTATTGAAPAYTSISGITIAEGANTDFGTGTIVFTLTAPGGWQFNTAAVPSFTTPPGDISGVSASYVSGALVFTVTVTGTATLDNIVINNLQVEPTSTSASPGYIYASSVSPALSGIATGSSGTDFANVSINTPATPTVSIAASPSGTVCSGTNVTFTPTATNAGTSPTYQWLVNGGVVASGATYSTTTLANGDKVSSVMTPAGGLTCVFPATVTSNTITATVGTPPTATIVSGGGTFCGSTTITASGGTGGTIYYQGTTSGGTSTATPSTSQVIASSGTYYFRSMSPGGCWGVEGSVTVTINPVPTAVTVTGGTTTCGGTQTINASGGTGGTIYYQGTTSGGTSTATASSSQVVSTSGTYYFRAATGAGCWSVEGSTVVTINTPATASAGSAQSVCAGSSVTLAGSVGGGASSGTWSAPSGSFSNVNSLTSTYTPSIPNGTVTLTLTSNDPDGAGPCSAATSTVVITVNATPTAVTVFPTSGSTFCGSQGITASGGTGGTMYYQGLTSGGTSTATPTNTVTVTSTGTYFFRALSGAGCWSTEGSSLININTPATVNAGSPQTACSGSTITLAGSLGGGASSVTWSAPSGTFSNVTSLSSTYTPSITSGNVTLTLTSNDPDGAGPCGVATSTVVITVNTAATVTAGSAQTVCSNGSITLAGSIGGGATSSFWTAPSGTFGTPTSPTSTYTPGIGSGTTTLTLTTNDPDGAGPCLAVASTVVVTVNQAATVTAGPAQSLCAGNTVTLAGVMGGSASTVTWSAASGSFSDVTSPGSTYTPSVPSGTVTLTLTTNDPDGAGPCTVATSTVAITVNALPTAYTVTGGGAYCAGGAGVAIGLNNSAAGINYQLKRGATAVGSPVAGIGTNITFGNQLVAGTYSVVATNATTSCTNAMTGTATVTVNPLPTAYAVTGGGQYCAGGTGVHVGLFSSETGVSYQLQIGGVPTGTAMIGTGLSLDFGLQTAGGNYTVVATNSSTGCTNNMTGSVNVVVNPLPVAETVSGGGHYCAGGAGLHVFLTPSATGINYQLFNGPATVGAPVAGTGSALDFGAQMAAGTYSVVATDATTGCVNNMTGSATIVIDPLPVVETVTGGGHYCAGGAGLHVGLSSSEGSNITYDLYDNATLVTSLTGINAALDFGLQTGAGSYSVIATNTTTTCTSTMTSTVTITIDPLPVAQTISSGGAYCAGGAGVDITLGGSETTVSYQLYLGGVPTGSPIPGTGSTLDFGNQTAAGNYTIVGTNTTTGCTNNMTGTAVITINPLPIAQAVSTGGHYCAGGAGIDVNIASSQTTVGYQLYLGGVPVGGLVTGTGGLLDFGFQTAAGTYTVEGTDLTTFCTNFMTGSSVIVIDPLPIVYNVSGGGAYCAGGGGVPVTLSNSEIGVNYQTFINGTPGAIDAGTGSAITHNQTAAGIYTVVATNATTGCTSNMTGSATVTINPLPAAIAGSANVCEGATTTLSDATSGGAWTSSNTAIATIDPVTGMVSGIAAGTTNIVYTLTLTGCSVSRSETVNPLPVVAAISGAATVCSGSSVTFSDPTTGGVWSSASPLTASVNPSTGVVTGGTPGTAMISYTVTSLFGCVTSVESSIISLAVPVVDPIIGSVTNVCAGLTINLGETTPGGVWSTSNYSVASVDVSGVVTGVGFGSAYISYSVTNSNGCTISSTYGVSIGNPMPNSAVLPASGSATLCHGNPANLSVTSVSTALTYQWSVGGTPISGATDSTYIATTAGTYTAMIGNGTCFVTLASVNVVNPPVPVILYDTVANVLYTGSFTSYKWYLNDKATDTTYSTPRVSGGSYTVVVNDINGCSDTSATYFYDAPVITRVNQVVNASDVKIYPNPVSTILYVDAPAAVTVTVIGADGKMLLAQKEAKSINVGQLANGMYMIMIYDENNMLVKAEKFIKQ